MATAMYFGETHTTQTTSLMDFASRTSDKSRQSDRRETNLNHDPFTHEEYQMTEKKQIKISWKTWRKNKCDWTSELFCSQTFPKVVISIHSAWYLNFSNKLFHINKHANRWLIDLLNKIKVELIDCDVEYSFNKCSYVKLIFGTAVMFATNRSNKTTTGIRRR